ncbi:YoaK family protein [Maribacter sp. 1_MG-2023]|uniref:YoaK family protein n=1 Tax=Maribacter sp. 1_MG-2023 TaxID=3062677 RepID=UPI0034A44074
MGYNQLTTNVTGHFALFMNDVANLEFWKGTIYLLYIFSFLFGSFFSSFLIEKFRKNKKLNVFVLPTAIECLILIAIPPYSDAFEITNSDLIVCSLLFAIGLQNSFVTRISNAVVRTTHLTGLFTGLGIEFSQLFFPERHPNREKLKSTIKLRLYIICFFFHGGITGGFLYLQLKMEYTICWRTNFIGKFVL